jgi:hypothetical protein
LLLSSRLASKATPAAICRAFDFAGMSGFRLRKVQDGEAARVRGLA